MKSILKFLTAFVFIPLVVVSVVYSLNQHGFFNITHIEVQVENNGVQPQYLQPYLKEMDAYLETFRDQSLWQIDIKRISSAVGQKQWISGVSVSRSWPSTLSVHILCKEVRAVWLSSNGKFFPVANNGEMMTSIEMKQMPDVMILRGENFEKKSDLRKSAIELINELPPSGTFSQKTVSEIRFDSKDGFWLTLIKDGIQVKMGRDQIALKSARVSQVLEYMKTKNQEPVSIDANLSKKVLVRLKSE
jgi:cell division protein FtsQ